MGMEKHRDRQKDEQTDLEGSWKEFAALSKEIKQQKRKKRTKIKFSP